MNFFMHVAISLLDACPAAINHTKKSTKILLFTNYNMSTFRMHYFSWINITEFV